MTKSILLFLALVFQGIIYCQTTINFENDMKLEIVISKFDSKKSKIDTCHTKEMSYICLIDGLPWFGSDMALELPKYKVESIVFIHNENHVNLDVSGMFNPTFTGEIDRRHFEVNAFSDTHFELSGWFSDGAGMYCVKWKITDNEQLRTLISSSEEDCF